ncbi:hypothetical protein CRG98_016632 [Punica granatum]|uniref:Uncharacterized protein n=1 Tax=Punica granatum TaxID=22663 RepID=A0A2I0K4D8_PUNGR|nr:hypothetical protein CRG98_016632 [Punica granatum]
MDYILLIGNALIEDKADITGQYNFLASHALILDEMAENLKRYCSFTRTTKIEPSPQCLAATMAVKPNILNGIDMYRIYAPLCHNSKLTSKPTKASVTKYDPCRDHYVHAYMNLPEVQKALHANVTKLKYEWQSGSNMIHDTWRDSPSTIIPSSTSLWRTAFESGLSVVIQTALVPVTSTKYSIKKMNLAAKTAWHPWYIVVEVGGYTQVYNDGIPTFATVKAAGHEVPAYETQRALSLISHFLARTSLPNR